MNRLLACWIIFALLGFGATSALAQTPEDYFHEAAQLYLDEAYDQALQTVNEGLQVDPDHPKLNALREQLDDLEQQPNGGAPDPDGAPEDEDADEETDAEEGDDEEEAPADEDASDPPEEDAEASDEAAPLPDDLDGDADDEMDPDLDPEEEPAEEMPDGSPHTMSRMEALRLLDTIESQELQLLRETLQGDASSEDVEKPW